MIWLLAFFGFFAFLLFDQWRDKTMEARYGEAYTKPRDRVLKGFFRVLGWGGAVVLLLFVLVECGKHRAYNGSDSVYDAGPADRE